MAYFLAPDWSQTLMLQKPGNIAKILECGADFIMKLFLYDGID
jgi:hypothetical protein